jgi:hypothetical protein
MEHTIYRIPQEFKDRFQDRFQDRFRIRWSHEWDEWQLEQKVRRGVAGQPVDQNRYKDDVIRYRDGFVWVMSFKNGTQFPCPKCHLTLKAPTRKTEMIQCRYCQLSGNDSRWIASFWPMDDALIEHIERMEKEIDQRSHQLHSAHAALEKQQMRQVLDPTLDGFQDRFEQGMGIQSVGYTGKVFTG